MKKTYIREGSVAWYCKRLWKPVLVIGLTGTVLVSAVAFAESRPNIPQVEKEPLKVEYFKAESVEDMICVQCEKYGVDAELALAIAKLETGNFTSEAYTELNNVGGLSMNEEPLEFKDLERGVEAFVMNLHYNYIAEGLDTVEEIAAKYCPANAEHWSESVNALIRGSIYGE